MIALLLAVGFTAPAQAVTVNFSYTGAGDPFNDPGATATATGSFTTDSTGATLSAFNLTLTLAYGGYSDTFSYALADVLTFDAIYSGSTVTGLSFSTDTQAATYNWGEALFVTGVGTGGGTTNNFDLGNTSEGNTTATVVSSPVPEPASMLLLGCGALGLLAARRRRA
jgi:hypothetical protein